MPTFAGVLGLEEAPSVVAVDIPIGLLAHGVRGGRDCDREARALLGRPRCYSVFSPPVRATLGTKPYTVALRVNRQHGGIGVSQQAFAIMPKIDEVDRSIAPVDQQRVREVHPEVCFAAIAGTSMAEPKTTSGGRSERIAALQSPRGGFTAVSAFVTAHRSGDVGADDILDAMAACWSSDRIARGTACAIPGVAPPPDARGLSMQIWR